jgi:hypothetical protein
MLESIISSYHCFKGRIGDQTKNVKAQEKDGVYIKIE